MNKKTLIIIAIEIILLLILYIFTKSNYIGIIPECWVYENTSLLCPTCGGTRCVLYMLKGNFIKAFFSNIVLFLFIVYLLCINIIYLINLNKRKKILEFMYPKYWYTIIFAVALMIYTIIRNLL